MARSTSRASPGAANASWIWSSPERRPIPQRGSPQEGFLKPVCVYRASQRGRLPLAESLLQSAGIPFVASGEHLQQLTGLDVFGPAELYVDASDAEDALAVLGDLDREG